MSWSSEGLVVLRALLGDDATPFEFSDQRLTQLLAVSYWQVYQRVGERLARGYVVDVEDLTVTPDPAGTSLEDADRDESFMGLATLKAACTLQKGAARKAAGNSFSLKDRDLFVDTRAKSAALLDLLREGVSFCGEYEDALKAFMTASADSVAAAVIGPFRYSLSGGARRGGRGRQYFG